MTVMYPIFFRCHLIDEYQMTVMNPIFFRCHLIDKHQATVMNPIFLRCVLSSDGQGPGDRDEPHFFKMCTVI